MEFLKCDSQEKPCNLIRFRNDSGDNVKKAILFEVLTVILDNARLFVRETEDGKTKCSTKAILYSNVVLNNKTRLLRTHCLTVGASEVNKPRQAYMTLYD